MAQTQTTTDATSWRPLVRAGLRRQPRPARKVGTARLLPVLVPVYLSGALVTAAALWSLARDPPSAEEAAGLLALFIASVVSEAFPIPIEGVSVSRTSLATVFVVAAAALYGWAPATPLAALTMAAVELGRRRELSRTAYNTALYALSAAAAGFARETLPADGLASLTVGTLLASAAFYVVDITLLAAVISRSTRQRILGLWWQIVWSTAGPFAIMASFTLILVVLWDRSPWIALALAAPLGAIAVYQRWMQGALDRLRELDRLKSEFIAVVSHELRTPLASVYGAGMTLQRPDLDEHVRESMLGIIYGESARLARLVDQVLWASRLESGRVDARDARSDGAEVARDVVEAARTHLPQGLTVEEVRVVEPLPEVAAEAEKVKQILVNLVENAVKYSPDGGVVEVVVEPGAGRVRFSVRDEGLGIPPAEQERIFEKFHRLDPLLTRGVGGTGLGLYICRELVLRLGGRIWVQSREGEGSTFSVELPAALPPA